MLEIKALTPIVSPHHDNVCYVWSWWMVDSMTGEGDWCYDGRRAQNIRMLRKDALNVFWVFSLLSSLIISMYFRRASFFSSSHTTDHMYQ